MQFYKCIYKYINNNLVNLLQLFSSKCQPLGGSTVFIVYSRLVFKSTVWRHCYYQGRSGNQITWTPRPRAVPHNDCRAAFHRQLVLHAEENVISNIKAMHLNYTQLHVRACVRVLMN